MQTSSRESIEFYVRNGYWGEESLESLFRRTVAIHPGRLALVDPPDRSSFTQGEPCRLSYSELFEAVKNVSARLLDAGIRKDQVVVTQLPNIVETVVLNLALARIGALVCPMSVEEGGASLATLASQLDPVMYIGCRYKQRDLLSRAGTWLPEFCQLAGFGCQDEGVLDLSFDRPVLPEQVSHLGRVMSGVPVSPNEVFTLTLKRGGGKTVKPVIPRTHNQWFALASFVYEGASLRNGDTLLCAYPLSDVAGIGGFLYNWLMAGARLVLDQTGSPEGLVQTLLSEKVTCAGIPPAQLQQVVEILQATPAAESDRLRTIVSGFGPVADETADHMAGFNNLTVLNCYATSEGASLIAMPADRCDGWTVGLFPRFDCEIEGWESRMSRMVSTRLVDPQGGGEITAPGRPGELQVKGPSVFDHYYRNYKVEDGDEDLMPEYADNGYLRTGDLFVIDESNPRFYRFIGRTEMLLPEDQD